MSLSAGDKLGPYEIVAPLGKGGMGEVYRARDPRAGREVAIKVSAERFSDRFSREVHAIAALNHPNICTLYDVGSSYLVLELVEGPTLAERIQGGAIPLEEALAIAKQIAEALDAAHEKGITHRDLKPGNVKIREDGTVKVLDFGLALLSPDRQGGESNAVTVTLGATEAGAILGTAAYMAPEQARGQKVDKRADIWSFGVVLWEMLTGKRLFEGETISDILVSVLSKEPDWESVPVKARRLLRSCLEKDPRRRLRDIGDAWRLPEEASQTAPSQSRLSWAMAGVLATALAVALWAPWRTTRPAEQPLVRLDVDLGPDVTLGPRGTVNAILSPDGKRLVYVSQGRLFTRRLDQSKATELAGTQGVTTPFFSPDGQWVAFFAQGSLKKISLAGGSPVTLAPAGASYTGGSWGDDGDIIAALDIAGPLSRIPAAGGAPTPITELDRERREVTHRWPQILPGGKAVLFTAHTSTDVFEGATIEVLSLADRRRKTLQRGGTHGRYLPSGHLVYLNQGTLFAVPFDIDSVALRGTPVPVLDQVAYSTQFGSADLDISQSGALIYRSGESAGMVNVQWLDAGGKTQPVRANLRQIFYARLSPDGQRLAVSTEGDLWVYDPQRDTMTRLTFDRTGASSPVWTPDGRYIVFETQRGLFWTRADGAGKPQLLMDRKSVEDPWTFTADGKRLAYSELAAGTDLWTVPVETDATGMRAGKPEAFLQTPFNEGFGAFSPDGRWMAYDSDESGAHEIYVRAFPEAPSGPGGKWQISNGGGRYPQWSRSGRELFFSGADQRIMVAAYTVKGDSFLAEKPRVWSEKRLAPLFARPTFDLAPDGKRVVALFSVEGPGEQRAQSHVILLQNFFDELRRTVPPGK